MNLNDLEMNSTKFKKIPQCYSLQRITFILPIECSHYQKKIINNKEELRGINEKKIYLLDSANSPKIMNFLLAKTKEIDYSEEFYLKNKKSITLLVGPMCSGKTSELIDYCEKDTEKNNILVFKNPFDNLRKVEFLYTRDEKKI